MAKINKSDMLNNQPFFPKLSKDETAKLEFLKKGESIFNSPKEPTGPENILNTDEVLSKNENLYEFVGQEIKLNDTDELQYTFTNRSSVTKPIEDNPYTTSDYKATMPPKTESELLTARIEKIIKKSGYKPVLINKFPNEKINLKELGLQGSISDTNSVPKTLRENAYNMQQLDYILTKWGYEIVYTSNMGGSTHNKGPLSHYKGKKVDLNVYKDGKLKKLTREQLDYLHKLGYWGVNADNKHTGALGYETTHYDFHIGEYVLPDESDETLVALKSISEGNIQNAAKDFSSNVQAKKSEEPDDPFKYIKY